MEAANDKRNRRNAYLGTALFHAVVLVLFMIFGFRTPLPLPAESGIAVNFGFDESGTGDTEPTEVGSDAQQQSSAAPSSSSSSETADLNSQTQDVEEAAAIKPVTKPKPTTDPVKPVTKPADKPVEDPKPTVNPKALYPGKGAGSSGGSQGNTGGTGNQGSPDGDPNNPRQGAGGQGGDVGSPGHDLVGRSIVIRPKISDNSQISGTVVVFIGVNRNGIVERAQIVPKNSQGTKTTIGNIALQEKCKSAAFETKFNPSDTQEELQKGYLVFIFTLQ